MESRVHILLIEHHPADRVMFEEELKKVSFRYVLHLAETTDDIKKILADFLPDVVICDFVSLSLTAPEAIHHLHSLMPTVPVIIYSGTKDEEIVVESMKAGAADYIFKGHSTRLSHSIIRAMQQKRMQEELAHERGRFNTLAKVSTVGIFLAAEDGFFLYVNERWCSIMGLSPEQALGDGFLNAVHSHDRKRIKTEWHRCVRERIPFHAEYRVFRESDQSEVWVLGHALPEMMEDGTVAGFVGTITDITYRMHSEIEIDSSRKQLRALTVRLQSVREEERTHIAREIHDDLGQALTGLRMDLVWLTNKLSQNGDGISQRLKSMMQLTDSTIHKVRKIATDLRPGILDDIGLAAAIEWHAKDVGERSGIQFSFDLNEEIQLDEQRSTAFFRIFQESLTNVMRHAQAKRVHAALKKEGNTIVMVIEDDGKGIAEHELSNPRSVGILGMKERAAFFGGEVSVIGVPEKGTTVRVRIPVTTH